MLMRDYKNISMKKVSTKTNVSEDKELLLKIALKVGLLGLAIASLVMPEAEILKFMEPNVADYAKLFWHR